MLQGEYRYGDLLCRICFWKRGFIYDGNQMIENLVKPVPLNNDVAVIKILQLMGQLTPEDIEHVLNIVNQVYKVVGQEE